VWSIILQDTTRPLTVSPSFWKAKLGAPPPPPENWEEEDEASEMVFMDMLISLSITNVSRLSVATLLRQEDVELCSEVQGLRSGVPLVLEALDVGVDHVSHVAQVGFVLEPCGFHPLGLVAVLVSEDPRERVLLGAGVLNHFSPAEYSPMAVSVSGSALPAWSWRWNSLNSSRSSPRFLHALPRAWASAIE